MKKSKGCLPYEGYKVPFLKIKKDHAAFLKKKNVR